MFLGGNCHIIKSNKLCSTELINNKNNEKSIDGSIKLLIFILFHVHCLHLTFIM